MTIDYAKGPQGREADERDWRQALKRGFACSCPRCGAGRMFGKFLKVNPVCDSCGLNLDGHRADDMPPYVVMMIVGHIVVAMLMAADDLTDWPMWVQMTLWPLVTLVMSLALIQPVKGALIGYQWALKMHGFDPEGRDPALPHPLPDSAPR